MLDANDTDKDALSHTLAGPLRYWQKSGRVPERIDTGRPSPRAPAGPVGFLAALFPRLYMSSDVASMEQLAAQIEAERQGELYGNPPTYYDQNLLLFARAFVEGRYRFAGDGRLRTRWADFCGEGHPGTPPP
jgi:endoglucanase